MRYFGFLFFILSVIIGFLILPKTAVALITTQKFSAYGINKTQVQLEWLNSNDDNYSQTVIRFNTDGTFPTTTSTGQPAIIKNGTKNIADSYAHDVTNGLVYYYSAFACNASGTDCSIALNAIAAGMEIVVNDNFDSFTLGDINNQGFWQKQSLTSYNIISDSAGGQVLSGSNSAYSYLTSQLFNLAGQMFDTRDARMLVDFKRTAGNFFPHIHFRYGTVGALSQGYAVWQASGSQIRLSQINSSGALADTLASSAAFSVASDAWYTMEVIVLNLNNGNPYFEVRVWNQGGNRPIDALFSYTDTANYATSGKGISLSSWIASGQYDNFKVYAANETGGPHVKIISPQSAVASAPHVATKTATSVALASIYTIPYIQTSSTIMTSALAGMVPSGGGIEFVLDNGTSIVDYTSPYSASFINTVKGEHRIDAYVVDSGGQRSDESANPYAHDYLTSIGVGDVILVLGDSTTAGSGGYSTASAISNWTEAPAGQVSNDNRNFPWRTTYNGNYFSSFLVDLNNKLTGFFGYPIFIINGGISGYSTKSFVESVVNLTPFDDVIASFVPTYIILDLGVNDVPIHSASVFKDYYQSLINELNTNNGVAFNKIYLTKFGFRNDTHKTTQEQNHIPAIDELLAANFLISRGPDFFTYFKANYGALYADALHPNVSGYQAKAALYTINFIYPLSISANQSGNNVNLSWGNLALYEPTISGYKIKYGKQSGNYTNTINVGNVTTYSLSGLDADTTYYFTLSAYDNAATPDETKNGNEVSLHTPAQLSSQSSNTGGGSSVITLPAAAVSTSTIQKINEVAASSTLINVPIDAEGEKIIKSSDNNFFNSPTSTIKSDIFKKNLWIGVSGLSVKELQIALKNLGYFKFPNITGYFGPITVKAVRQFQKKYNIKPVSGIVGPKTRKVLNDFFAAQ